MPCPECGCPYPNDHTLECQYSVMDTLKVRRITEILRQYYKPQDERIIAPENVLSSIDRVLRS